MRDGDQVVAAVRAEALCDGILARLMDDGVTLLAAGQMTRVPREPEPEDLEVAESEGSTRALSAAGSLDVLRPAGARDDELRARISRLMSLQRCGQRVRRELAQAPLVADRIRDHALDWLELTGQRLSFTREGAAREAKLLLRDRESPAGTRTSRVSSSKREDVGGPGFGSLDQHR